MEEVVDENEKSRKECLELLASPDYIMEPTVSDTIKQLFSCGAAPEQVVDLLSENYAATAQTANLLAEWLIVTGVPVTDVQLMVENHLKSLIVKHFDPLKADSIFNLEEGVPSWLTEMIDHPIWRNMMYQLAEEHPNCLMLNFTIKLISDSGYEGEITNVAVASQQLEVFSKVIKTSISKLVEEGIENKQQNLKEIIELSCRGEHTYLYAQMLLNTLAQNSTKGYIAKRIMQEVEIAAREKGYNVTPISLALNQAIEHPKVYASLDSMLTKNALNSSDITNLFKFYSSSEPPPVDLLRNSKFLDMLISYFFEPNAKPNEEHKSKYLYLLAYACSVAESYKKSLRKGYNKDELKATQDCIEKAYQICLENKTSSELLGDLHELFVCIRCISASVGILKWIELTILDPGYFKINTDSSPVHLLILDEIVNVHQQLHDRVLNLLIKIFETNFHELDHLLQLQLKKTILDRMVHLLSRDHVIPVVSYMNKCWKNQETDASLIRHFVIEVLDMIGPPYSNEFISLFLPLVDNENINSSLKVDEDKAVKEFLAYCKDIQQ